MLLPTFHLVFVVLGLLFNVSEGTVGLPGSFSMWTTKASAPNSLIEAAMATLGQYLIHSRMGNTWRYDTEMDIWSDLPDPPSPTRASAMEGITPTLAILVGGRETNHTTVVDWVSGYNLLTDSWTILASLPASRHRLALTVDDNGFAYALAGKELANTDTNFVYMPLLDAWTIKAAAPSSRNYCGAGHYLGHISLVGGFGSDTTNEIYVIQQDVWYTASPLPTGRLCTELVSVLDGDMFVLSGGDPTVFASTVLEVYSMFHDTWTSLAPSPLDHYKGVVAHTTFSPGVFGLFAVGGDGGANHMHMLHFTWGSFVGDPVVTSLAGSVHHLDLFPGVFNLLTSPSLVVNVAVDVVASLPPGEDLVTTMVGIVAQLPDESIALMDCTVNFEINDFVCRTHQLSLGQPVTSIHSFASMSPNNRGFDVVLPHWVAHITFRRLSVCTVSAGAVTVGSPSSWMDVFVRPSLHVNTELHPNELGGLLFDPSCEASRFEIQSGCLYELPPHATSANTGARAAVERMGVC